MKEQPRYSCVHQPTGETMPIIHALTIAASCAGLALTAITTMTGDISTGLAIATAALFVFTAFIGFCNLIEE
jgi:hypothetical protein